MPVLPEGPRKAADGLREFAQRLDYAANSSAVASVLVAAIAIVLAVLNVEFQYVAGAFLIYGAQRIVQKRISPTVLHVPQETDKPRPRPSYRELLDPRKPQGPSDEATA